MPATLTIGTRNSALARWQTDHIIQQLQNAWPNLRCNIRPFVTQGDKTLDKPLPQIGGKGLFTAELEQALRAGEIDLAVHSLKDLPIDSPPGLTLGAIGSRANVRDVLIARDDRTLFTLPRNARIGTSSLRRQAQLFVARPDLDIQPIRGNVETRIRKVMQGDYDATLLAAAGVERLNITTGIREQLSLNIMLPAPGQAALAVQCREDDAVTLKLLLAVDDPHTRAATTAERSFLASLGGGCSVPVAAYARVIAFDTLTVHMRGLVAAPDGSRTIRVESSGNDPQQLGEQLAQHALRQGAEEILSNV